MKPFLVVALASFCALSARLEAAPQATLAAVGAKVSCAALLKADLTAATGAQTQLTAATEVSAGAANSYCKVEGVIAPAIRFEVHLPIAGWTQRYLQTGCGGLCGTLNVRADQANGCAPVEHGEFVIASTDMGHEGPGGAWAAGNPQAMVDFAYRGVHVTAVAAKALVAAYYGRGPRYSYFSGCSDGGREALMEAQRYPADFDGIAAGAPAYNFSVQNSFYHAWNALSNTGSDGRAILTTAQLPVLHAAAVARCDELDGLKDGLIEDPRRCEFDPAVVQCQAGQAGDNCLSAAQVEAARRIYGGARDASGRRLVIGGPMPGSELAWAGVYVPAREGAPIFSAQIAQDAVQNLYYESALPAGWSLKDLRFDEATLDSFTLRRIYDATNPDLGPFRKRGGKLLVWHGWSDPHISPLNSIAYYEAVRKLAGTAAAEASIRLFLLPGMYHCRGGEGPSDFDILSPLMAWVERGDAPKQLVARHLAQGSSVADRVRPVFPWPQLARYTGQGSLDAAQSFVAAEPKAAALPPVEWLGAKYMVPGLQQACEVVAGKFACVAAQPK